MSILIISQRLPLKYKAPKVLAQKALEALTLAELNKQWTDERIALKTFLESLPDKHIQKKIYKHPVVGMLDVVQAITFFREHVYHHKPQIDFILKNKMSKT